MPVSEGKGKKTIFCSPPTRTAAAAERKRFRKGGGHRKNPREQKGKRGEAFRCSSNGKKKKVGGNRWQEKGSLAL